MNIETALLELLKEPSNEMMRDEILIAMHENGYGFAETAQALKQLIDRNELDESESPVMMTFFRINPRKTVEAHLKAGMMMVHTSHEAPRFQQHVVDYEAWMEDEGQYYLTRRGQMIHAPEDIYDDLDDLLNTMADIAPFGLWEIKEVAQEIRE